MNFKLVRELTDLSVLLAGIFFLLLGIGLYRLASPSPHGYVEIFFAVPLCCIGLAIIGSSFLMETTGRLKSAKLTIGWLFVLLAVAPFLYLAWFFLL